VRPRKLTSTRICRQCQIEKPIREFCRSRTCATGYTGHCLLCNRLRQKISKAKRNPFDVKFEQIKRKFNIDKQDYIKILEGQKYKCPICKIDLKLTANSLAFTCAVVDHCHETSKVRGILCKRCNLLLGHANDSIDRLKGAIAYLKCHPKK
jgi:Recombination endonuclease VII